MNNVYIFGLPKDYPGDVPGQDRRGHAGAGEGRGVDASRLGQFVVAIVGDYAKVKDQLAAYKDITFLDTDGKVIPAAPVTDA